MTVYVLVLLAYLNGVVHHEVYRVESREACTEMANQAMAKMPGVTAGCAILKTEAI